MRAPGRTAGAPARRPSQEWATGTPQSENIDAAALANAFTQAQSAPGLSSLVVVRNGKRVAEQYFLGTDADALHDVRSVTKSVTSLLVGIAIDKKILPGVNEPLGSLIHPPVAQVDSGKASITIAHLLTMTSGFTWDESTAQGYNDWILSPSQVDYLLSKPLSDAPGTWGTYNWAAVHLLSVGLTLATGESEEAFADANLFAPLHITQRDWEVDAQGFDNGVAGVDLRSRDLAKLGQLVLQGGKSGTQQIVPQQWVANSLAVHWTPGGGIGPLTHLRYGYL